MFHLSINQSSPKKYEVLYINLYYHTNIANIT